MSRHAFTWASVTFSWEESAYCTVVTALALHPSPTPDHHREVYLVLQWEKDLCYPLIVVSPTWHTIQASHMNALATSPPSASAARAPPNMSSELAKVSMLLRLSNIIENENGDTTTWRHSSGWGYSSITLRFRSWYTKHQLVNWCRYTTHQMISASPLLWLHSSLMLI